MTFDPAAPTVAVFSHPNHELAIFGFLQAFAPSLVYLTDGGGENRLEQTRQGLQRIGLKERATFLNYTESSFYEGLLDRDTAFYAEVASRLGQVLETLHPAQVLCDAVEFYNPVHDLSLPLVRAALRGAPGISVFEVPLVYETPSKAETCEIQHATPDRSAAAISFDLPAEHLDAKIRARDEVYTLLTDQLPIILAIPRQRLAMETIVPAPSEVPGPDDFRAMRYERRAQLLLERGEIERKITYLDHYMPVAASLVAGLESRPAANS